MFGKVNWFGGYNSKRDTQNEFGFIKTARGDVYFHKSVIDDFENVSRLLNENQLVRLECERSKKGLKATTVEVLSNIDHLDDASIDELKSSGLELSTSIGFEIESRIVNRLNTWEGFLQKAEEWINERSHTNGVHNVLYSSIRPRIPTFKDPQDCQAYLSPCQSFSPIMLRELMSSTDIKKVTSFLNNYGFILNDEDLNFGLQQYLDKSDQPKRHLLIKFFRRLDEDRILWLAESITKHLKAIGYVSTVEQMMELLNIFRSMSPLYHMTHKENITNILEHGLVSHNKAHSERLVKLDISLREAQSRRSHLHDHVPLYFNPRNTMLYRRKEQEPDIVMIALSPLLLLSCWKILDGNGASSYSKIYITSNATLLKKILQTLEWDIIMSESWNSEDPDVKSKRRRIMCAEALAPEVVPIGMIEYIGYASSQSRDIIQKDCVSNNIMCLESPNLYFEYHGNRLRRLR